MVDKYKISEMLEDDRIFNIGEIWLVRDELVSLLPADRLVDEPRKIHFTRLVLITQGCEENGNKLFPVIRVAPMGSNMEYIGKFDIELKKDVDADGINRTCMAKIQLEQPMLKKDLYKKIGDITEEKLYELIALQTELMGVQLED